jgi:hypothetical protein
MWVRGVLIDGDHAWGACMGGLEHRTEDALSCVGITIGGLQGAAARLGVKRTTLLYRMDKLAIPRQSW